MKSQGANTLKENDEFRPAIMITTDFRSAVGYSKLVFTEMYNDHYYRLFLS